MNILIYDVAASSGGALTILNEYYNKYEKIRDGNHYYFVISTPNFKNTNNITVLRFPWVKKSWLHRVCFELFDTHRLVKKYKINKIFSLQNLIVLRTNIDQDLYVHQSLPFIEYKYGWQENKLFWVYQNVIGKLIVYSIKKAKKIIVQTRWMKEACVRKSGCDSTKFFVQMPKLDLTHIVQYVGQENKVMTFFYPATAVPYKNHQVILDACKLLNSDNAHFEIIFTISGKENELARKLREEAKQYNLPIEFRGTITRNEVLKLYSKTVLLFPSYVETLGLPLLEARQSKAPIIAADTVFAREILKDYKRKVYFRHDDSKLLAACMQKAIRTGEL